jgi:hypothetical protein
MNLITTQTAMGLESTKVALIYIAAPAAEA